MKKEGTALLVMETKIRGKHVKNVKHTLGFVGSFAVDSDGLNGGIWLFWSKEEKVELKNYSTSHISVVVFG